MRLVAKLEEGERVADLMREFGVSRKTIYKWKERYMRLGPNGLYDESRAPLEPPERYSSEVKRLCLDLRREKPTWGAGKVRAALEHRHPGIKLPAPSSLHEWFEKEGLVVRRRKRATSTRLTTVRAEGELPNQIWCTDYKGQFRLGDGKYCYPLTITDHATRYLFACEGFERIDGRNAVLVFEDLFGRYGIPDVIRSDNGAPFASQGLLGLSKLSVFWLRQGIALDRITPGHPEQNGRHERMHRTLKADTTRPPARTLLSQQERFDLFRECFNHERPHEALDNQRPADIYVPSTKVFSPRAVLEYPLHDEVRVVSKSGRLTILRHGPTLFLSEVLAGERVGLRELDNGDVLVSFAKFDLGVFEPGSRRFKPREEAAFEADEIVASKSTELSPMSPD